MSTEIAFGLGWACGALMALIGMAALVGILGRLEGGHIMRPNRPPTKLPPGAHGASPNETPKIPPKGTQPLKRGEQ